MVRIARRLAACIHDPRAPERIVHGLDERRAEEAEGVVRWLRPEFQAPEEAARRAVQTEMAIDGPTALAAQPWPKDTPAQYTALRRAITTTPAAPQDIARQFKGAPRGAKLRAMLATLAALGQARAMADGRYAA